MPCSAGKAAGRAWPGCAHLPEPRGGQGGAVSLALSLSKALGAEQARDQPAMAWLRVHWMGSAMWHCSCAGTPVTQVWQDLQLIPVFGARSAARALLELGGALLLQGDRGSRCILQGTGQG